MSLYIRSKDGIFGVLNLAEFYTDNVRDYPLEYALKTANNPIELCDGFYIESEGSEFSLTRVFSDFDKAKIQYDLFKSNDDNVRLIGFIKTDTGLLFCLRYDDEDNKFITLWDNIDFKYYNEWKDSVIRGD